MSDAFYSDVRIMLTEST